MSGDHFLTQTSGALPADLSNIPATDQGQFAKVAVDRVTRAKLVKVVNLDASKGGAYVTNTDTYAGNIKAVAAHEDSVVAFVSESMAGDLSAVPIPKGMVYLIDAQQVTPASGKITIYAK